MNCTSEHCSGFARYITFLKCNWAMRAAWLAEEASVYLAGHEHSGVEGGQGHWNSDDKIHGIVEQGVGAAVAPPNDGCSCR